MLFTNPVDMSFNYFWIEFVDDLLHLLEWCPLSEVYAHSA